MLPKTHPKRAAEKELCLWSYRSVGAEVTPKSKDPFTHYTSVAHVH